MQQHQNLRNFCIFCNRKQICHDYWLSLSSRTSQGTTVELGKRTRNRMKKGILYLENQIYDQILHRKRAKKKGKVYLKIWKDRKVRPVYGWDLGKEVAQGPEKKKKNTEGPRMKDENQKKGKYHRAPLQPHAPLGMCQLFILKMNIREYYVS